MVKTATTPENQSDSRRERRKEETRSQIFQAAMRLFERKGVFNTTVEEIATSADVAKGTFFNYFPSKEAILTKLADRQVGVIKKAAEEAKDAPSMRPILISMAHDLAAGPARSQMMLRSLLSVVLNTDLLRELFQKNLELGRQSMATIMERGQKLGELIGSRPAELQVRSGRIPWITEYTDARQELVLHRSNSGADLLVIK